MDQRTLTRRAAAAKDELTEIFGYNFCYADVIEILNDKSRRSKEDRLMLDDYLKSLDASSINLKSAADYRDAFKEYVVSESNPNGKIFRDRKSWNKNLWEKLADLQNSYEHPVKFMERIVDDLGDHAFRGASLRLRILKQMLYGVDFGGTDIELGEVLAPFNTDDKKKVNELDESVFDTAYGYKLKPADDITALVRCFKDTVYIDRSDAARKTLAGYLNVSVRDGYLAGEAPLLIYIDSLLTNKVPFDEIFDTSLHSADKIRDDIKDAVNSYIKSFDFISKEFIDSFPKMEKPHLYYKAFNFIMKNIDTFRFYNRIAICIDDDKLEAGLKLYSERPDDGTVFKCSDEDAVVYKECYDGFSEWYMKCYAKRKSFNQPKKKYHERGGEWEKRELSKSDLIEYCSYLSSGGTTELDRVFAKKALYLFAFAFGMKYYPDKDKEYDPQLDIEKNLFRDFYNDNMIQFLGSGYGIKRYEREPNGVGINFKNYLECLYLYYLNNNEIPARERYGCAVGTAKAVLKMEKKTDPAGFLVEEGRTCIFRETHLTRLFKCSDKAELIAYIINNYTITRKNRSMSVYSIEDESVSAYEQFRFLIDKLIFSISDNDADKTKNAYSIRLFIENYVKSALEQSFEESGIDIPLVYEVLDRIDADKLLSTDSGNITRTKLITAYFLYFCSEYNHSELTFSETYDYFCYVDDYLEEAGLQPVSPKNIFDMILILLAYGFTNFIE